MLGDSAQCPACRRVFLNLVGELFQDVRGRCHRLAFDGPRVGKGSQLNFHSCHTEPPTREGGGFKTVFGWGGELVGNAQDGCSVGAGAGIKQRWEMD